MHVLHVVESLSGAGGAERALAAAAPHLVRAGVRLDVAYLRADGTGTQQALHERLAEAGASLFCVERPGRLRAAAALRSLIRRRRPDLVHTARYEAGLVGRTAANAARVPVVSAPGAPPYGPRPPQAGGAAWRARAAHAADAVTAVGVRRFQAPTRHSAAVTARRLAVDPGRIDVVPPGRDPRVLGTVTEARRAAARAALGLAPDVPAVLAAARQRHGAGLDVLTTCWPLLRARVPDAVLLLAGAEGDRTPQLRRSAAGDASVRLLGHRADLYDLMAACDAVAVPSRGEGADGTAVEAMGVGVPLVASDVPALRETVGADGHALLVPPDRPDELHTALLDTLTHRDAAAKRAAAAREHFLRHYTLERVSHLMLASYRRALLPGG